LAAQRGASVAIRPYSIRCWNCLSDYDAVSAVWCSCDPKNPTKLCPYCFQCFCQADETYKDQFWGQAPQELKDEIATLKKTKDRLGEILIQNQKVTTPELLEALAEQRKTGGLLGKILIEKGLVTQNDIDEALRYQGYKPLVDTQGQDFNPQPDVASTTPHEVLKYLLTLGAKKGASDVHIEPLEDELTIKYRIDGFFYRINPLPRHMLEPLLRDVGNLFHLDGPTDGLPQRARLLTQIEERDYELILQTLPTRAGTSATIKLIDRRTFLKNFTALGLGPAEQLALTRALDAHFGMVIVSAPAFNGAITTCYSMMDHVAKSDRKVVSLETPVQWQIPYVNQIEVRPQAGLSLEDALRSVMSVKPDVLFVFELTDKNAAGLVSQLATSLLVVVSFPAFSAAEAVWRLYELGVPPSLLGQSLSMVLCQRLVRKICTICREGGGVADPKKLAPYGVSIEEARALKLYRGRGCPTCNKLGYRRRKGIFEQMIVDRSLREQIAQRLPPPELQAAACLLGMETLRDRCLRDVREGVTSIDEFIRWRF
jgi:type IV pilus assembly protein PilB